MAFNILVVDDDPVVRKVIIRALSASGLRLVEVYEAGDGKEALRLINEHEIDFALVDLHMPVMDGKELMEKLKNDPDMDKLPLIFISGEHDPGQLDPLERRSYGFIQKPFKPETLGEKIVNLLSPSVA